LARFWRAFGIGGGVEPPHPPPPHSVRHCFLVNFLTKKFHPSCNLKMRRRSALLEYSLFFHDQMDMRNSSLGTPIQSHHVMPKHRHDDFTFRQITTDTDLYLKLSQASAFNHSTQAVVPLNSNVMLTRDGDNVFCTATHYGLGPSEDRHLWWARYCAPV